MEKKLSSKKSARPNISRKARATNLRATVALSSSNLLDNEYDDDNNDHYDDDDHNHDDDADEPYGTALIQAPVEREPDFAASFDAPKLTNDNDDDDDDDLNNSGVYNTSHFDDAVKPKTLELDDDDVYDDDDDDNIDPSAFTFPTAPPE